MRLERDLGAAPLLQWLQLASLLCLSGREKCTVLLVALVLGGRVVCAQSQGVNN